MHFSTGSNSVLYFAGSICVLTHSQDSGEVHPASKPMALLFILLNMAQLLNMASLVVDNSVAG